MEQDLQDRSRRSQDETAAGSHYLREKTFVLLLSVDVPGYNESI